MWGFIMTGKKECERLTHEAQPGSAMTEQCSQKDMHDGWAHNL